MKGTTLLNRVRAWSRSPLSRGSLAFTVVVIMWEVVSSLDLYNVYLFPPPSRIAAAFSQMITSGEWFRDVQDSLLRYGAGFVLGNVSGVLLGLVTGRIQFLRDSIGVLLNFLRSTPSVALIPLAIVWFGIGEQEKIFLVAWGVRSCFKTRHASRFNSR